MRVKVLEVRDRGTHIPVFALSTEPDPAGNQHYGLTRAGFTDGRAIILGYLAGERPSSADNHRRAAEAHGYWAIDKETT